MIKHLETELTLPSFETRSSEIFCQPMNVLFLADFDVVPSLLIESMDCLKRVKMYCLDMCFGLFSDVM